MSHTEESQRQTMANADQVCASDPLQLGIRTELLEIHGALVTPDYEPGDPSDTYVFQMAINRDTGEATSMPLEVATRLVRYFADRLDGVVPASLELISRFVTDPHAAGRLPDSVSGSIDAMLREYTLADGWELYGYGICSTCLSVRADVPNAEEIARSEDPQSHPGTRPLWYAHLVGSDSRVWSVLHQRGHEVVYGTIGPDEAQVDFPEMVPLIRLLHAARTAATHE